jgi:hypothetical protein
VLPVAKAAVEAVQHPGTELDGTEIGGAQRGLRGRWVRLRTRGRSPQGEVESPESTESPELEDPADAPEITKSPDREDAGDSVR